MADTLLTSLSAGWRAWGATPWRRRWRALVLSVLGLWVLLWLAMPPVVKWQLERLAGERLGRAVSVERVIVRPWSMSLGLEGLRVSTADGTADQFSLERLWVDAELSSLLRGGPVVDGLTLTAPRLRLAHLGEGRWDVDDVLARLAPPADAPPPGEPLRFALFNMALTGGEITVDDRPAATVHRLSDLTLTVPFLSNLPSRRTVTTEPRLAFDLNGDRFDTEATTLPFDDSHRTEARLRLQGVDLARYQAYWPAAWPLRLRAGVLDADLRLAFEQRETPQVALSGTVSLDGLAIDEAGVAPGAPPVLGWRRLSVVLDRIEPLARRASVGAVTLDGVSLAVARDAQGRLNWQRHAAAIAPPRPVSPTSTPPAVPAWQATLASLAVTDGRVDWRDEAIRPAAAVPVRDIALSVEALRWPMTEPAAVSLEARVADAAVRAQGRASDREAELDLSWRDLVPAPYAPYLATRLVPALDARMAGDVALRWRAGRGGSEAPAPLSPESPVLSVQARTLEVQSLRLGPNRQPLLAADRIALSDARVDLVGRDVSLGQLSVAGLRTAVQRDSAGRWMAQDWWRAAADGGGDPPTGETAPPWRVGVREFTLDAPQLGFDDRQPARPVSLRVSALSLKAQDLQPLADRPVAATVSLQARVAGARGGDPGRLRLEGTVQPPGPASPLRLRQRVQVDRFPLHALEPYVSERLNLELLRADASARGTVELELGPDGLRHDAALDLAIEDLLAHTREPAEELLSWKSLQLRGLKTRAQPGQPLRLSVAETALSDYFARVLIDEQGRINLQNLVRPAATPGSPAPAADAGPATAAVSPAAPAVTKATAAATAAPAAPSPVASAAPDIRFGPVSLVNGRVRFSDRFIQPNYTANLSELTGTLSAFASQPAAPGEPPALADLSLKGRAEGTAALDIGGRLNPLARPLALDIKAQVRNLELPPLSPYSAKYAGYGIERGKLSVDLAYRVDPDGQLNASNQIVLNQLTFGERIEGSNAPNLPVKLAVALLADRDGVIDINLPISGSLNDPQFRLGPVIVKVIFNLIGKAITAPFSLIASALGGGGPELSQVAFAAGTADLDATGRERLDAVAKALTNRPALRLTVQGQSDPERERDGVRRARLDEQVRAEKRRALARAGGTVPPVVTVSADEYPALLKEVYRRADIAKPRNLVGLAKDLPVPEMEKLLMAAVPVTDNALRDLAVARAVAVKDYLAARGLGEERLFLGAPRVGAAGADWAPRAELTLATR